MSAEREVPRVYLAGKVSGDKWKVCEPARDLFRFVSSDGSNHSEHLWGIGYGWFPVSCDLVDRVDRESLQPLATSQFLVAYLDTPDSYGSIVEIAYASFLGKPVAMIVNGGPDKSEEGLPPERYCQMYDAYYFVSALYGVRAYPVTSLVDARRIMVRVCHIAYRDSMMSGLSAPTRCHGA